MFSRLSIVARHPGWIPRTSQTTTAFANSLGAQAKRWRTYQAFDANLDKEALADAREWFSKFDESQLPKGSTTYTRAQGPGGQHVNKTESKAVTSWRVGELLSILPKNLHSQIRLSRYYTETSDSLTFRCQTTRDRNRNQEENREKLMDEITRIYQENTPNETSAEKKKKFEEVAELYHEGRVRSKKIKGDKKKFRKPSFD